ncbi:hypothetical protein VTI74DRAFT_2795 [Chaetomium olivicolor]
MAPAHPPMGPEDSNYAHRSCGYTVLRTVLRTVHIPELDAPFPTAMERLKRYGYYWCHYSRFPLFGALCESKTIAFTKPSDELARRFYLYIIEGKVNLWVAGADPDAVRRNPRFCSCLVVDAESLVSLAQMPDDSYRGWMKLRAFGMETPWSDQLTRDTEKSSVLYHQEKPPGSGMDYVMEQVS